MKCSADSIPVTDFTNFHDYNHAKAVTGTVISKNFICGKNYQVVKENLRADANAKLMFTGLKGVGKTICLLALWQEYIQSSVRAILLSVDTIKFLRSHITKSYLESLGIPLSTVTDEESLEREIMNIL